MSSVVELRLRRPAFIGNRQVNVLGRAKDLSLMAILAAGQTKEARFIHSFSAGNDDDDDDEGKKEGGRTRGSKRGTHLSGDKEGRSTIRVM